MAGFFVVVSVLGLGLILGNRYEFEFNIGEAGIEIISRSRRAHVTHRLAVLAGLFGRNIGAVGAGLSGVASEYRSVTWKDIKKLKAYPVKKVLSVREGIMPAVYVYCTRDNFQRVVGYVEGKTGKKSIVCRKDGK